MTRRKFNLKEKVVNWGSYVTPASTIEEEAKAIQEEAKLLQDCDGVYFEYCSDYNGDVELRWIFYREETEEEYNKRVVSEATRQQNYKRSQYEQLKKELGL
jgi:hypothetical protein